MPSGFVADLRRHAAEAIAFEDAQADEFLSLLADLRDTLLGRLLRIDPDDQPFNAWRLGQVLAEVEAALASLEAKAAHAYGEAAKDAAEMATRHLSSELRVMGKALGREPVVIPLKAAAVLADSSQQLLANHYATSVKRYGLDLLNQIRARLFVGLRAGDAMRDMARDIAAEQGPLGRVGRVNAERLVRTEQAQVYNVAHLDAAREAKKAIPDLKIVWHKVTSYDCPVCNPLHMTEREIGGTWTVRQGKRVKQVAAPPAHPRCGCRTLVVRASWRKRIKELGYLDLPVEDPLSKRKAA